MASQYSLLRNYGEYVSPYNLDLIAQSMGYMQQKVDTNREMLNQYADSLLNVDIIKPQDREYLQSRLQGLIQDVNDAYRGSNLASGGVARQIKSYIGQAMDERVLNAVAGTREFRKLQKTIEDIKLNDPEKYSPVNEGMAYMPAMAWMEDGKVGSRLQPLHYTPYYDYSDEVDGMMKQAVGNRKAKKVYSFPSGQRDGDMIVTTIDSYTPEEIIEDITPSLSQRALAQINLEGQYMALTNPGLFNQATTADFVKRYTDVYDKKERALLGEIKNAAGDQNKLAGLNARLGALRAHRQKFVDEANSFIGQSYDPARAGAFIVRNEFLNGVANRWSYDNSYSEMAVDDAYFKRREADRADANLEIARKNLDLRAKELEIKAAEAAGKSGKTGDKDGNGIPAGSPGTVVTIASNVEKEVGSVEDFYERYGTNENSKNGSLAKIKNSMTADNIQAINDDIELNPQKYADCQTEADKYYKYFLNNGGASSPMIADKEEYLRFVGYYNKEVRYNNISGQAEKAWDDFLNAPSSENPNFSVWEQTLIDIAKEGEGLMGFGRGLDIWTDRGIMNADEVIGSTGMIPIGGRMMSAIDVLKVSSLAGLIGEFSGNIVPGTRGAQNEYKEKLILNEINKLMGTDMTIEQLQVAKRRSRIATVYSPSAVGGSNQGYLDYNIDYGDTKMNALHDIINHAILKSRSAFGHEWGNYSVKKLIEDAYSAYENVYDTTKDQWGMRAYTLTRDQDEATYDEMLNIYTHNGGNKKGLVNLSATIDEEGQAWIIGNYEKQNTLGIEHGGEQNRIAVRYKDLIDNGIPVYRSSDEIQAQHYKSPAPVPVSFPSDTNKDYGRFMYNNFPELPYASKTDAINFALSTNLIGQFSKRNDLIVYYSDGKSYADVRQTLNSADNGRMIEEKAFYMAAMDNADLFKVSVDGTKGNGEFVEVSIYDKDNMDEPLITYEEPNIAYVDRVAELMQVCPQVFYIRAIDRILNKEYQNFSIPESEGYRTADMQAILSVGKVAADMDANINKYLKIKEE